MEEVKNRGRQSAKKIEIASLISELADRRPKLIGKTPLRRAVMIVEGALRELSRTISNNSEGAVEIPNLGTFVSRRVDAVGRGEKAKITKTRFLPKKGKARLPKRGKKESAV